MECEELLRSYPPTARAHGGLRQDHARLGDGATSMNLPAIYVPAGPMLKVTGARTRSVSGSDTWKYWAELRAGTINERDWQEIEDGIARSPGTCMTDGHGGDHDVHRRGLGFRSPAPRPSRARLEPFEDGDPRRQAHRRDGVEDLKPRIF